MPLSLKVLYWISAIALTVGLATVVITFATWPSYDIAAEYAKALEAADYAGADASAAIPPLTDPDNPIRIAVVSAAAGLFSAGFLALLFALHANAVAPRAS